MQARCVCRGESEEEEEERERERERRFSGTNVSVCVKSNHKLSVLTRASRRMRTGAEIAKRASNSASASLGKIRISSLPISSLPLLVLLHWDIGNDGEPHCACAELNQPADGRGDARFLTYTSSAWPKGGKKKGEKVRGNLDVRVGMGPHTESQPEPAGPILRPEGPPGTPEAELAAKLFDPFFHIFDFNPGR